MLKSVFLLFGFLAVASGQCGANSFDNGLICSCFSSYFDPTCSTFMEGCPINTPELLSTTPIAEFMAGQSFVHANNFTFLITSALKDQRYFESINVGSCPFDSHFSFVDTGNCVDSIVGQYSIPELTACGFVSSSDASFTTLSGPIHLVAKEPLGNFRGHNVVRTTASTKGIAIHLPTSITLTSSNITVSAPIDLMAAVVGQFYDPLAGEGAGEVTIEILTSVQYPYKLMTSSLRPVPLFQSTPITADTDCVEGSGDCVQTTTFILSGFGGEFCNINGNYSLDFTYDCRPGVECPVDGSDVSTVDFHLESEDLCAFVEFTSSISGALASFTDNTYTVPTLAYLDGSEVFLEALLNADVAISSVSVVSVLVKPVGGNAPFNTEYFQDTPPSANGARFQFPVDLASLGFTDLGVFNVDATLSVTYVTSFKRDVVTESLTVSKQIVMSKA